MTYRLLRLAPGSYDLVLDDVIVGSVVREDPADRAFPVWHAELLDDPPQERRPHPFSKIDHTFGTLDAVAMWLEGAEIIDCASLA
ncbi:hypothetical protein ACLBWX_10175 [Methylobacterium sp. M6A4_1b]